MSNPVPHQSRHRLSELVSQLQRQGNLHREDIIPALGAIEYIFRISGKSFDDENLNLSKVIGEFKDILLGYLDHIVRVYNSRGDIKAYFKLFNVEPSDKAISHLKTLLNSLQKSGNSWFGVYVQSFNGRESVKALPASSNDAESPIFLGQATLLVEDYRRQISIFREIVLNIYTQNPALTETIAQFAVSRDYSSQNPEVPLLTFSDELRVRISDMQELFKIIADLFLQSAFEEIKENGITLLNLEQLLLAFDKNLAAQLVKVIEEFQAIVPGSESFLTTYFSKIIKNIKATYERIKKYPRQAMFLLTSEIGKFVTVKLNPQDFIQLSSEVSIVGKIPLTELGGSSKITVEGYVLPDRHNLNFALSLVDKSQDPETWYRLAKAHRYVKNYEDSMQRREEKTAQELLDKHQAKYPDNEYSDLITAINKNSKALRERIISLNILTGQMILPGSANSQATTEAARQISEKIKTQIEQMGLFQQLLKIITDLKNFSTETNYGEPKHTQIAVKEIWRTFIPILNKISPFLSDDQLDTIVEELNGYQDFVLLIQKEDDRISFKAPANTGYDLQRRLRSVQYKQTLLASAVAKYSHVSGENVHTSQLLLRDYRHHLLAKEKEIEKESELMRSLSEFLRDLQNSEFIGTLLNHKRLIPSLLANLRILERKFPRDFPSQFFTAITAFLATELDQNKLGQLVLYTRHFDRQILAVIENIAALQADYANQKSQIVRELQTRENLSGFIKANWDAQLSGIPERTGLPAFSSIIKSFSKLQDSVRYGVECSISFESPEKLIEAIENYRPGSFKREEGKAISAIKYRFNGGEIKINRARPTEKDKVMEALKDFIPFLKIILPFFKNKTFDLTLCLDIFNILYSDELSNVYGAEKKQVEAKINEGKEARELVKRIQQKMRLVIKLETAKKKVMAAPGQLLARMQGLQLAFLASEQ